MVHSTLSTQDPLRCAVICGKFIGWSYIKKDIIGFVAKCPNCQQVKVEHQMPISTLQKFSIPYLEMGSREHGFGYKVASICHQHDTIWVIIDRITKSAHFFPVHTSYSTENYVKLYIRKLVKLAGSISYHFR